MGIPGKNGSPLMCESVIRTVIGRTGVRGPSFAATFTSANSGRYFATGSSRFTFPSSTSVINVAAAIAFVLEANQKSESGRIGVFASRSA